MILGFHYHSPAIQDENGSIKMPGYLGVFIDSLAKEIEQVVCFLHTPLPTEMSEIDYVLKSSNVKLIGMGPHSSVPQRLINSRHILAPLRNEVRKTDVLLLRAPSPLSPEFFRMFKKDTVIAWLLVGNYLTTNIQQPALRKFFIRLFFYYNYHYQCKGVKQCLTMVNNKAVYNENLRIAKEIHEVRTTTLSIEDFFERNDTCQTQPVHLLYAGRLDLEKGLIEMVEATAQLAREQYNVVLNLVGWENHGSNIITTKLKALSRKLGVADRVIFHGKKRIGEDLNLVYRASDIFLIASKGSEGFPRTIWEAMANSVPVIASKAGSIPLLLKDRQHCLLIEQNSSGDIVEKIKNLINDPTLRQRLIREGRLLVRENTLEIQAQRMVGLLKSYLHKEKLEIKTIPAS